ncbi:hypothetical protein QJS10_CPB14g01336 [Acorus calamus]|uniref:Reverse transcriptase domain-containing protein n=1 Tax=Acorus calamus TaxID=4465 RepID=A0AAV9DC11_ACOCL|nr:hypothetical protein QJS10_CPB14g01336 [Acorus calamus]
MACVKVDLRKAFDSVRWDFLENVLVGMNFPSLRIRWVMQCVRTASYSVLVNGSPQGFFTSKCGLRQGDPCSPLLFVLAMQALSSMIESEGKGLRELIQGVGQLLWGPPETITVNNFLRDGRWVKPWRWPANFEYLWEEISQLEAGDSGSDILIWSMNKIGVASPTSAVNSLREQRSSPSWCKEIWHLVQPPRFSLLAWQGALTRLPTMDRLLQQGLVRENQWIVEGIKLCVNHGATKIWSESDSTTALAWANGRGIIPWSAFRLLRQLSSLLSNVKSWKSSHVYREGNTVADYLASAQSEVGSQFDINSIPTFLLGHGAKYLE